MEPIYQNLYEALGSVQGYIFPNEIDLQWGILIVVYPFITGLVAGAFILASLERVFKVKILKSTYQIALLTALSFLLVATMPLISHLSQPQRAYEIMITPHSSSAMAIFGFVYLWYLMVVLLLEIWFDYRPSMVVWANEKKGFMRWVYRVLTLGVSDISPRAVELGQETGIYHYRNRNSVSFYFTWICRFYIRINKGKSMVVHTVNANHFSLFGNGVRNFACHAGLYGDIIFRKKAIEVEVLDSIGKYLFFVLILDFTLEGLDQIHRIYEAEESFEIIKLLVSGKLYLTLFVSQGLVGT